MSINIDFLFVMWYVYKNWIF